MFATIQSNNIVGYQTKEVRKNLSVQLPTFDGVATTGINIQDIKPVCEGLESGDFTIQLYNQYGLIEAAYIYCFGEDIDMEVDGWYNEDFDTLIDKTFAVGEAFNVLCAREDGSLQYAGQVLTNQVVVPARKNLSAQGNFRPTAVNIQDIIPSVADGYELESGDFTIQLYNQYGLIEAAYIYCFGEDIDMEDDGWYNEDFDTLIEKTFEPGEGFNLLAAKPGSLTFPALSL